MKFSLIAVLFVTLAAQLRADDFTLRDGRAITNATVLSKDASSVTLRTGSGIERIRMANMDEATQQRLAYDPAKAADYDNRSAAAAAAAAKQQADRKALAAKVNSATQWQGSVLNIYPYGMIVMVTRANDFNTTAQLLLVGHPKQREFGVSSKICFRGYREGTQKVPEWDQNFEKWVWVQDAEAIAPSTSYRVRTIIPETDEYSRCGMYVGSPRRSSVK